MKKIIHYFLFVAAFIIINSCKDDPEPTPVPTIASISPTAGVAETEVTIIGTGFEATASANSVKFNGVEAVVVSATATQIVAKAPAAAGTGKVSVTTTAGSVEGPEFTYLNPPTISSVDPLTGGFGTPVTVTGTNFFSTTSGNTVKINGVAADITSASATQLMITVPVGAGTGKVTVTTADGTVEGPDFVYQLTTVVTTLAGDGIAGYQDGTGSSARFDIPTGLALDKNNNIYVGDRRNNRVRKITPSGVVTTFAGSGVSGGADGVGTTAEFAGPTGLFFDESGDLFVTCASSGQIKKIKPDGTVTTFAGIFGQGYADGPALSAQFGFCTSIIKDSKGDFFVADFGNHVIRKISGGEVSTFAGMYDVSGVGDFADGTGSAARFNAPNYVIVDANDNLYVSDYFNHKIRKITPDAVVTTIAGGDEGFADGPALSAQFVFPYGITFNKDGDMLIADGNNRRIRVLSAEGQVTTLAGGDEEDLIDGLAQDARFTLPQGIVINSKGEIYVADRRKPAIRKIVIQ